MPRSRKSRCLCLFAAIGFVVAAWALPAHLKVFQNTYDVKPGTRLFRANCAVCHIGTSRSNNEYGRALKKALRESGRTELSPDILRAIEGADSDKDGYTNRAEILADTLPGNAKSSPATESQD